MIHNRPKKYRAEKFVKIAILSCLAIEWFLYACFGHQLIRAMYEGKSIGILNKIIEGANSHPITMYYEIADSLYFFISIIFVILSLIIYVIYKKWHETLSVIRNGFLEINMKKCVGIVQSKVLKNIRFILVSLGLLIFFFGIYFSNSFLLAKTNAFKQYNILFEIDTPRAIGDIANFSFYHHRTKVHPLYVLMVNPLGCLVKFMMHSDIITAVAINSFFGALAVCLAFVFFFLLSKNYTNSLLLSCIFGFSASQIILSTVPDTSSLATCSLLITYILFLISLQKKRLFLVPWVIAGILCLGVTTTNIIQTLICFSLSAIVINEDKKGKYYVISQIIAFLISVVFVTILFSLVQKIVYRSSSLFFLPTAYREDLGYTSLCILHQPLKVTAQIVKHFFLVNIIAPLPNVFVMHGITLPALTFASSWNYTMIGCFGMVLWVYIFAGGIVKLFFDKQKNIPFYIGVSLCLLFNIFLHSFYGVGEKNKIEFFMYTGNFTFLIILFLSNYLISKKPLTRTLLIMLTLLMAFNNSLIMRQIITIYK